MRKLYKVRSSWGGGEQVVQYELHTEESAQQRQSDLGVIVVSSVDPNKIRIRDLKNLRLGELIELAQGE
jgi:hypothetical protein